MSPMPSINHISDFPDKLNPMLVKELRQGLRGISFVVLFIAIQAFLCFILLITAAVASHENAGHLLSRVIFFFYSLAVLVVQPLRGIGGLQSEIKNNTIDILYLTRLSAWRITFGKWISIVSQSALILTAIIPYLILRYFFGDMQIFSEILLMLSIFLLSALFTAGTVGFSALKSVIIRVLLPIIAAFFVFIFIWNLFFDGRQTFLTLLRPVTLDSLTTTLTFLSFIIVCVYAIWMLLDLGTSLMAPVSENRATRRRIISLGLITISLLVFAVAKVDMEVSLALSLAFCVPVSVISLTENTNLAQPIVAPFTRKGMIGSAAGRALYPGWATGLVFVLLLYGLIQGLMHFSYRANAEAITLLNSAFAFLLFPLALTRLFAKKHDNRFGIYLIFICTQFLIVLIVIAAEEFIDGGKLQIMQCFFWVPTSIIHLGESSRFSETALLNVSYINVILYASIALTSSLPVWKHIRDVERVSKNEQ